MKLRTLVIVLICFVPHWVLAQGFAGMGTEAEGFAVPQAAPVFDFPADHAAHPDYRIEWWYLTANLQAEDGTDYGLQWTLFRSALAPGDAEGWDSPQIWFAHAAVTTPDRHFAAERFARGGIGQAGVQADPFDAWIDEWRMWGPSFDAMQLTANGADFGYDMALVAQGPLVFHGEDGFSVKSMEGQASYYYSQPFFDISGTLRLPDGEVEVTGQAWLDREWSSQPLSETQLGWDWFSLSFEAGNKLMAFQLRQTDGTSFESGTWITADGTTKAMGDDAVRLTPLVVTEVDGRDVPTVWRLEVPAREIDVTVSALNPSSWMPLTVPYWEGPVDVTGSHPGIGYLEMTGYQ